MCRASLPKPDKILWVYCLECGHYRSCKHPYDFLTTLGCGHLAEKQAPYNEVVQFKSTDEYEAHLMKGCDPSAPLLLEDYEPYDPTGGLRMCRL